MHIFSSIIQALQENSARRFTQMLFLNADSGFVLLADTNHRGLVTFDCQLSLAIEMFVQSGWILCLQFPRGIFQFNKI